MSGRPFAVPCAVCGLPRSSHDGKSIIYPSGPHPYAPNESSAEWAALKLREALESLRDWAKGDRQISSMDAYAQTALAIALADAAGIKPDEVPA